MAIDQIERLADGIVAIDDQIWLLRLFPELLFLAPSELEAEMPVLPLREETPSTSETLPEGAARLRDLLDLRHRLVAEAPSPDIFRAILCPQIQSAVEAERYLRGLFGGG